MRKLVTVGLVLIGAVLWLNTASLARKPVVLTLANAQAMAVDNNQMLEAARAGVDGARAGKLQTWAGHLPSVRLSESAMRSNDAVNAFGFRLKQERFTQADFAVTSLNYPVAISNFQTKLEVRQPIFNGGQTLYQRAQATAGILAAEGDLARGKDEVRFRTAEAYWGLVLAREALKAVRAGLETAESNASAAEVRYREEAAPLSDLLAARVRVADLKSEEIAAENRVADAGDGLTLVMGTDVVAEVFTADTLAHRRLAPDLDALIARAMVSRPDLVAARRRSEAARKGVGAARAAYLPHLNAFVEVSLDSDEMFRRKGESWMAGAMVSWDLFSGGRSIGGVRAARAGAAGAEAQAAFVEAEVVRDVRRAYRGIVAADAQVDVAGEALSQAKERLRITQLQYREGLATATDLLGAEAGFTHARVRRLQALNALNVGLARLEFSVGEPIK